MLNLPFHHIGFASKNIENELRIFANLGFDIESSFVDSTQGVRGIFITKGDFRLELLENLPSSHTLDNYLNGNIKMYHIAFISQDIKKDLDSILSIDFNHINGGGG
ncbi:VOC family protein [Helicobacter saguini]|nr:VOC family protein [Helicobacter saguini]MWV61799.1 VOC family protein [Helicobacter saguini]MWV69878.1 VOC family protein [Helicobacter saguini]MWV72905.1 VOC family protein [Helicobacter saguini]